MFEFNFNVSFYIFFLHNSPRWQSFGLIKYELLAIIIIKLFSEFWVFLTFFHKKKRVIFVRFKVNLLAVCTNLGKLSRLESSKRTTLIYTYIHKNRNHRKKTFFPIRIQFYLFHWFALAGSVRTVDELIKGGVEVDYINKEENSVIYSTALAGSPFTFTN